MSSTHTPSQNPATGSQKKLEPAAHTASMPVAHKLEKAEFLLLAIMVVAAFVLILNETLLGVALPNIMSDLGITASTAQWTSTGFMLTMAVVTPASGFIISRYSIRTVFVGAMAVFSLGTLVAATAPGIAFLLLGRVLQASGTGVMMPLLMTTMMRLVAPSKIGQAMGIIGMVISAAPAMGPTVSGLILSMGSWRLLFWLILPIGIIALLIGMRLAPADASQGSDQKLDALSMLLSTLGFGGLVLGLSSMGGESAHGGAHLPVNPWVIVIAAAAIIAIFVWRQIKLQARGPFMDMRIFRARPFTLTVLMSSIGMGVMLGTAILIPLYTANVLGISALATGLMLLPGGVLMAVLSPVVGRLSDRFGARALVLPGAVLFSASIWLMSTFSVSTQQWYIIATYMLMTFSLPFINTPMMGMGLGSLPQHLTAFGSSAMTTFQQVSGAAATAVFVALLGMGAAAHGGEGIEAYMAGVHLAFLVAAFLSFGSILIALFVPSGKQVPSGHMGH
ncbi:MAG: DHA2 family efflux MFS transporter permease subunit [Rothia sp. (in: high G+C Gram-positive bacteria)]|nr:DHA2 family efflux MFS transporter permease subunit [Rothia sp. (in: high G+C Gram-positive bacteria)]